MSGRPTVQDVTMDAALWWAVEALRRPRLDGMTRAAGMVAGLREALADPEIVAALEDAAFEEECHASSATLSAPGYEHAADFHTRRAKALRRLVAALAGGRETEEGG